MTAPKTVTQSEGGVLEFAGLSVYEIANAAAKEAKRINEGFHAAKQLPPDNLVRAVLKRVIDGQVGYKLEEDAPGNRGGDSKE